MSMKYTLRFAKPDDAEKLLEIYAPFVISSDRTLSDVSLNMRYRRQKNLQSESKYFCALSLYSL